MNLITDGLLMAAAMIAGIYCLVLSRRLRRLTDSGSGIGSQIAALDRALAETRGALAETREGVSEMRASARSAIAELKRRTEGAEEAAASLEEATGKADSLLHRLYEAHERVVALDRRTSASAEAATGADRTNGTAPRRPIVLDVDAADDNEEPAEGRDGAAEGKEPRSKEGREGPATSGAPAAVPESAPADGAPDRRAEKRKSGGIGT